MMFPFRGQFCSESSARAALFRNIVTALGWVVFLLPTAALAQSAENGPMVEEREPSIYYLPISNNTISEGGALERVLNFPAEQFRTWFKEVYLNRSPLELPKFSFDSVQADILVTTDDVAEIDVVYRIVPHATGWVRVPIGLERGIFRGAIQVSEDISVRLHRPEIQGSVGGYQVWCEVPADRSAALAPLKQEPIELTVRAIVPLSVRGDDVSLETSLPANAKCVVRLEIPQPDAIVTPKGSMVVKPREAVDGITLETLEYAGGPLHLTWRFDQTMPQEKVPELAVRGEIVVSVDAEDTITTQAMLDVVSQTTPFDSMIVAINDDCELVPEISQQNDYVLRALPRDAGDGSNRVLVEFPEPTKGPQRVSLTVRQANATASQQGRRDFRVGRFDVVGSRFQEGILHLRSADNVHVAWDSPRLMRERTTREADMQGTRVSFAYEHQPATLKVHTLPIQATARVLSEYELYVDQSDSQLVGKLSYRLPRTYREDLVVDLNGWKIDTVDAQGAQRWQPMENQPETLILPLTGEIGMDPAGNSPYRTIEVTLRAHRMHPSPLAGQISLPWVQPQAEALGTSTVQVIPVPNLDIRFDSELSTGFQLDRSRTSQADMGREHELMLRTSADNGPRELVLNVDVVPPRLIAGGSTEVVLSRDALHAQVVQAIEIELFHASLEKMTFRLPEGISWFDVVVARINGIEVAGELVEGSGSRGIEYPLAELSPPYRLELQYHAPLIASSEKPSAYVLPLISPETKQLAAQGMDIDFKPLAVSIEAPEPIEILSKTQSWPAGQDDSGLVRVELPPGQGDLIELTAPFVVPQVRKQVLVDFHWLQVGLTPNRRRDRAVFSLRTSLSELMITLPVGARNAEVYLDSVEQPLASTDSRVIEIELPVVDPAAEHRLEVWYEFEEGSGIGSQLSVASPQIENAVIGSQPGSESGYSFLQIITPGNWMVLSASSLSAEMDWNWDRGRYKRTPRLTQPQLERLASTSRQPAFPRGMNRFLYSTIGPIEGVTVTATKTSHLMLLFSGLSLGVVLLLFYVPQLRGTATFLTLGVGVVALAITLPDFAILFGEMAILGFILALLGLVLWRLALYRSPVRPSVRNRTADSHVSAAGAFATMAEPAKSPMSTASAAPFTSGSHSQ